MNSEAVTAPPEYVADFVRYVESLAPRFLMKVDTSLAHYYYGRNLDPIDAATLYIHHRPKVAQ